MAIPRLVVAVDLNGDGDWSDTDEDISAWVVGADWWNGFAKPFDPVARDSTATILLDNGDKRFSPESGSVFSANFTKGKKIRIQTVDPTGPTTRTHYVGWIDKIVPDPFVRGPTRCVVECVSLFDKAQDAESHVPIQENKTADQVIAAIIENSTIYPPGLGVKWLLGISGRGELGIYTYLGATTDYLDAEVGKTSFAYIGDQWGRGVNVLRALRDVCGREAIGRLTLTREGLLKFINRHHLITDTSSDETFTDVMVRFNYAYGKTVYNRIITKARTRKVGEAPEVLGRIDGTIRIVPGGSVTVAFNYADVTKSGVKMAGKNAITPIQSTDYLANSASDGSGSNLTSSVTAIIAAEKTTKSDVTFTNNHSTLTAYVLTGATIRGTAIRDFGEVIVERNDDTSQSAYEQVFPYTYGYEADNVADAEAIAEHLLTIFKSPFGELSSVTIDGMSTDGQLTSALTRQVFDRITITETQTGVASKDYFIISEKHHFEAGKAYQVTWGLEPAEAYVYWVLGNVGASELGLTTVMAPL